MEIIEKIWAEINPYIDIAYLISFMSIAYFLKGFFLELIIYITKKNFRESKVVKNFIVFLIGSLTALFFILFFEHDKMKLFVSFCVGTSLHDLLIKTLTTLYKAAINKIKTKDE